VPLLAGKFAGGFVDHPLRAGLAAIEHQNEGEQQCRRDAADDEDREPHRRRSRGVAVGEPHAPLLIPEIERHRPNSAEALGPAVRRRDQRVVVLRTVLEHLDAVAGTRAAGTLREVDLGVDDCDLGPTGSRQDDRECGSFAVAVDGHLERVADDDDAALDSFEARVCDLRCVGGDGEQTRKDVGARLAAAQHGFVAA